jgi:hypothetical protein
MKKNDAIVQIDGILKYFAKIKVIYSSGTSPNPDEDEVQQCITLGISAIHRLTNNRSIYKRQLEDIESNPKYNVYNRFSGILGILKALKVEIENDYIENISDIIMSEIIVDYLEMAENLLEINLKDPAAVIIGSTIEEKLRSLCVSNGISTLYEKNENKLPKTAEMMNQELYSNSIYNKNVMKAITAWMGIRNSAAHGKYDEYNQEQVITMHHYAIDFVSRKQFDA